MKKFKAILMATLVLGMSVTFTNTIRAQQEMQATSACQHLTLRQVCGGSSVSGIGNHTYLGFGGDIIPCSFQTYVGKTNLQCTSCGVVFSTDSQHSHGEYYHHAGCGGTNNVSCRIQ